MESKTFLKYAKQVVVLEDKLVRKVSEEEIFGELAQMQREITLTDEAAQMGDFVLCSVEAGGETVEKSLCVGNMGDLELDGLMAGHTAGDCFPAVYQGKTATVKVIHVKHPVSFDDKKDDFAKLRIEGVATREDYRQYYIRNHKERLQQEVIQRLLPSLVRQYVRAALADMESIDEGILEEYSERTAKNQREMLLGYVGGSEEEYEKLMESSYAKGSLAANEMASKEMAKYSYQGYFAALPVMREIGFEVSKAEYESNVRQSGQAFHMPEERYRVLCTFDDFCITMYSRKLQEQLFYYFAGQVRVVAEISD